MAVNSFGVGGANGHALLLSNKKLKQLEQDDIPRLVCVSGVTKSAVTTMLNKVRIVLSIVIANEEGCTVGNLILF